MELTYTQEGSAIVIFLPKPSAICPFRHLALLPLGYITTSSGAFFIAKPQHHKKMAFKSWEVIPYEEITVL